MTAGAAKPQGIALSFAWGGALLFVVSLAYFVYSYVFSFGRAVSGELRVRPILINSALFTIFAIHHSVFARSGAKAWLRARIHPSLERSVYTWVASLLFIIVCWQWEFLPGTMYRVPGPFAWIGYAAQAFGVLVIVKGSKVLDVFDLAGIRQIRVARAATATRHVPLVTDGVFGLVRHPIYLGWTLVVFGAPNMTATRFMFALVSTFYLALAIPWEERGLVSEFGTDYENYRRVVRWRMIPGIY